MISSFALCVQYDKNNAVSNTTNPFGAAQINDSFGLKDMSNRALEKAILDDNTFESEKAIPDSLGHLLYMNHQIRNCRADNANAACFNAWLGTMLIIGLAHLRGYNLSLEELDFSKAKTKVELSYKESLMQHDYIQQDFQKLYCICKDGQPIALVEKNLMVCPFLYIDPNVMKDVPWYIPEDSTQRKLASWMNLNDADFLSGAKHGALRDSERRVLLWWFAQQFDFNGGLQSAPRGLNDAAQKAMELLQLNGVSAPAATKCSLLQNVQLPDERYPFTARLFSVPDFSISMPSAAEIFSDVLLLVPGGKVGDSLVKGGQTPSVELIFDGKIYQYGTFIPFREKFAKFLNVHKNSIEITRFEMTAPDFAVTGAINVSLEAMIDGSAWHTNWTYRGSEQIYSCDSFFTSTLWPNFCAAEGSAPWNRYYITLCEPTDVSNYRYILRDYEKQDNTKITKLNVQKSLFVWKGNQVAPSIQIEQSEDNSETRRENEPLTKHWHWKHTVYESFPEYVNFALRQDTPVNREVGCLHLTPPKSIGIADVMDKAATFAIDFGTSNTICLAQIGSNQPEKICLHDASDVRPLVRFYRHLGNGVEEGEDDKFKMDEKMFGDYYWFGPKTLDSQIRTITQLYKYIKTPGSDELRVPENGRMIPTDANVIDHFIKNAAKDDVLYSNIKLCDNTDERNRRAAKAFLLHLELQCMLYAMKKGAKSIRFMFSYPDEQCRSWLNPMWTENLNQLKEFNLLPVKQDAPITYQECMAAAVFINGSRQRPSEEVGYTIIDIGGGTTDISLWRAMDADNDSGRYGGEAPRQRRGFAEQVTSNSVQPIATNTLHLLQKGSIRYAGNKILADSVYLTCKTVPEDCFRGLWNLPKNDTPEGEEKNRSFSGLYEALRSMSRLPENAQQSELAQNAEKRALIVNTFIDNFGFNSTIDWNEKTPNRAVKQLRSLLRVKILGLFYIISQYMREVKAIAFTDEDAFSHYMIQLAGGGSQILNLCGKEFLDILAALLLCNNGFEANLKNRVDIQIPNENKKMEVVLGMLNGGEMESDSGGKRAHVDRDLVCVENTARLGDKKFSSQIEQSYHEFVYNYLYEVLSNRGEYEVFGIYHSGNTTEMSAYSLLIDKEEENGKTLDSVNKQKIYDKFSPNFLALRETHLPEAILPAVVAVYTVDDMLESELDF